MRNIQRKKILIILTLMSILWLTCIFNTQINEQITKFFFSQDIVTRRNNLIVHFISVGQGDAIAINLPDDKIILIDSGTEDCSIEYTNYLRDNVLSNSKAKNIDYLILSHADQDHYGGSRRLIQEFNLKNVVMPYLDEDKDSYNDLKKIIVDNKINAIPVNEMEDLNTDLYKIKLFYIESDETNASSTVVKLSYRGNDFLFTGDIDIETENKLISQFKSEFDCDILKIAHHGSKLSTSIEFLNIVTPEHAIISCAKNSYGHPTDMVLKNIKNSGAEIYRTDVDGNIIFVVDNLIGLKVLKDNYHITNLWFNYAIVILIVELLIIFIVIVDIFKVMKKNRRDKKLLEKKS